MKIRLHRFAYIASVCVFLLSALSTEGRAQVFLRGKLLAPQGKPSGRASVKSLDFVSNAVIDSVQTSVDGTFSLPLRHSGINHVLFSIDNDKNYRARFYVERSIDLQVEFSQDSSAMPKFDFKGPHTRTAKLFGIYTELVEEFRSYRKATRNHPFRPGESSTGIFDWGPYVYRLDHRLNSETDSLVRQALLIARLVPSVFGDTLSPTAAKISLSSISPRHPFWEEATILCYTAERADYLSYLDTVVQGHPDPGTRAVNMFTYLPQGRAAHDSVRVHRYATRLLSEFPGSSLSKMAAPFATVSMRDLSVGDILPRFSFADLIRPQEQISIQQFRGKVSLLVFWATWCIHCVEQIPFLRAAYDRYKDDGLDVLSISLDDTRQKAVSFLEARAHLPWRQAYAIGGFNNEYVKQLGVYAAPAEFLVDKNGRVLATTNDLIRSKLDSTLARYFRK